MAENRILKEQNEIDEHTRNEYEKQILEHDLTKDKMVETEKCSKQEEYRQFLLKQIEEKKDREVKRSPTVLGNSYTYSEDLIAPELKKNLKLTKQMEMKNALDECIRMKNALKLENKQREIEEDRMRVDFVKKRETNELKVREQAKQQMEDKDQRNEETARQWRATNKEDEREQFIDSLLKRDTMLSELNNKDIDDVEAALLKDDSVPQPDEQSTEVGE